MSRPSKTFDRGLVLLPALAAALGASLLALLIPGEVESRLRESQDRMGTALTESLAGVALEGLTVSNDFLLVSALGRTARLPNVRSIWIADGNGQVVAHSDSREVGTQAENSALERLRGVTGAAAWPAGEERGYGVCVRAGEKVLGYTVLTLSSQGAARSAAEVAAFLWGGVVLCGGAGLIAGFALRARVRVARADLTRTAEDASHAAVAGELTRVTIERKDEWGAVASEIVDAVRRARGIAPGA